VIGTSECIFCFSFPESCLQAVYRNSISFSSRIGMETEFPDEVLKSVFPLLDGKDLVFCMLVCRQWREVAKDDYFWKCICSRKWPSICKQPPSDANYKKLYLTFSQPPTIKHLPVPRLAFEDLVFYIDMWLEGSLIFSQAISGCTLRVTLRTSRHPRYTCRTSEVTRLHHDVGS
jgi:hypothetical protein